mgnify:FL=1
MDSTLHSGYFSPHCACHRSARLAQRRRPERVAQANRCFDRRDFCDGRGDDCV